MKINHKFPPPDKIFINEVKTLMFLKDNPRIRTDFTRLSSDAYDYCCTLAGKNRREPPLAFHSQFPIHTERGEAIARVGAQIVTEEGNDSLVTYYLVICKSKRGRMNLLRKYHFDYTLPGAKSRQPHPVFHLQYAGGTVPGLEGLSDEHMSTWLSEPRIYFMPMSLALLINLTLKEFPNESNAKLRESREWRSLIIYNERLLMEPYFNACHAFILGRSADRLFTNDFFYGN